MEAGDGFVVLFLARPGESQLFQPLLDLVWMLLEILAGEIPDELAVLLIDQADGPPLPHGQADAQLKKHVWSPVSPVGHAQVHAANEAVNRMGDEAGRIEKTMSRGLWILETVVTAAPLMGLLGTITGMMQAFQVIGGSGLVAPTRVTSGVAQALISTALGLLIALIALFGFNFFSRAQSQALDDMERLGSKLADHIRLDQETGDVRSVRQVHEAGKDRMAL